MPVKYPHMLPEETKIWDAYLEREGLPEGKISYDVHLGAGVAPDPAWPAWMAKMVWSLSTHRLDVVVERPDEVLIVELKIVAGMGAVGQLLGYEALWLKDRGVARPVRLVCICDRIEADMETVFSFYEIEVIVMGA